MKGYKHNTGYKTGSGRTIWTDGEGRFFTMRNGRSWDLPTGYQVAMRNILKEKAKEA